MQRQAPNVASSGALLQYLSTHPATEERIERAEKAR
jgi:predicted Zn-dependent protease